MSTQAGFSFKTDTAAIKTALGVVKGAVDKSTWRPIDKTVLVSTYHKDQISLTAGGATDFMIRTLVDVKGITGIGGVAVPYLTLRDLLSTFPNDVLAAEYCVAATLGLECKRNRAHIKGFDTSEYPVFPDYAQRCDERPEIVVEPFDLGVILDRTVFSSSKNDDRPAFSGVCFRGSDEGLVLVSADGFRLSEQRTSIAAPDDLNVLLPRKAMGEVARLATNETESVRIVLDLEKNRVAFVFSSAQLVVQTVQSNFPPTTSYRNIIAEDCESKVVISRSKLLRAVREAEVIARESSNPMSVVVSFHDDKLTLEAETDEKTNGGANGWYNCELETTRCIGNGSFRLQLGYLKELLTAIGSQVTEIEMWCSQDKRTPVQVRIAGVETFKHVIMPMVL